MKSPLLPALICLGLAAGCSERHADSLDPGYTGEGKARAVVPPVAPTADEHWYACVAGDTLTRVAKAHHMTVAELIQRNDLKDSPVLTPGQRLVVRGAAGR